MQNELKYQVRSREIVDLVTAMRNGRLTISPYFQRNLVWREGHKRDFIDTILRGLPFPQIFLARGPLDVDTMESSACVVDGQQRLSAIREFVAGDFDVDGKKFPDLSQKEKEEFLKYEVAIIDFDLDAGDDKLKDVFKRLNRTFYSLSTIEKMATEFSGSEFLLVGRLLCGEIEKEVPDFEQEFTADLEEAGPTETVENQFVRDPAINEEVWNWLAAQAGGPFAMLVASDLVFSNYESQRKVPLMFVLNLQCTLMSGYFNRNGPVKEYLERYNERFEKSQELIDKFNSVAEAIRTLDIPPSSMWWNKANFFTMVAELGIHGPDKLVTDARTSLLAFEAQVPTDYALAAKEAVNNRGQRALRGRYFRTLAFGWEDAETQAAVAEPELPFEDAP